MISGHDLAGGTTPTPGSDIGLGLNQNISGQGGTKKSAKTEDVIYRIAALTAAIALLATFF